MRSSDLCGPIDVAIVDRQISRSSQSRLNDESIVRQSDPSHSVLVVSPFVRSILVSHTIPGNKSYAAAVARPATSWLVLVSSRVTKRDAKFIEARSSSRRAIPFSLALSLKVSKPRTSTCYRYRYVRVRTAFVGCVYSGLYPK